MLNFEAQQAPGRASIWCVAVQHQLVALGCSDGTVEFWDAAAGFRRGLFAQSGSGVTHICLRGSRVVTARVRGAVDFFDLRLAAGANEISQGQARTNGQSQIGAHGHGHSHIGAQGQGQIGAQTGAQGQLRCRLLKSTTAHQHPINCMVTSTSSVLTGSEDHTLKLFDLATCEFRASLQGHSASVWTAAVDDQLHVLYSSCAEGLICVWDLVESGSLIRRLCECQETGGPVELAICSGFLLGVTRDESLWLWSRSTGELVTRMRSDSIGSDAGFVFYPPKVVALSENIAATGNGNRIRFWDLRYKVLLREVPLEEPVGGTVRHLIAIDGNSVLCSVGKAVYRVTMPFVRL